MKLVREGNDPGSLLASRQAARNQAITRDSIIKAGGQQEFKNKSGKECSIELSKIEDPKTGKLTN